MDLPEEFRKNIVEVYGEDGKRWLANLPAHLQTLSRLYDLRSLRPMKNLSYNFVATVENSKQEKWVLKTGPAGADYRQETSWLKQNAKVAPRVHFFDQENNAFFMDFVPSTQTLQDLVYEGHDDQATHVLADLIVKMYGDGKGIPQGVPHLSTLISSFDFLHGKLPQAFVSKARALWQELTTSSPNDVFLH